MEADGRLEVFAVPKPTSGKPDGLNARIETLTCDVGDAMAEEEEDDAQAALERATSRLSDIAPVTTSPLWSTATQRPLLGQDTPSRPLEPSTSVTVQAAAPPVGLLEVTKLPLLSTATQRPLLGQDGPPGGWGTRTAADGRRAPVRTM